MAPIMSSWMSDPNKELPPESLKQKEDNRDKNKQSSSSPTYYSLWNGDDVVVGVPD